MQLRIVFPIRTAIITSLANHLVTNHTALRGKKTYDEIRDDAMTGELLFCEEDIHLRVLLLWAASRYRRVIVDNVSPTRRDIHIQVD